SPCAANFLSLFCTDDVSRGAANLWSASLKKAARFPRSAVSKKPTRKFLWFFPCGRQKSHRFAGILSDNGITQKEMGD
ncbi:MAG: hypothetical protein RSC36_04655, partial [Ruthenibacterium sp.]